jgi:hypothetical protein
VQTRLQLAFVLALALPSTGLLLGPTAGSPPSGTPKEAQAPYTSGLSLEPGLYRLAAIEHAPFSAFQINEGNAGLTHSKAPPLAISRDSLGRIRIEYPTMGNAPADRVLPVPEIRDQVAGFVYLLDVQKKIAYRSTLAKAGIVEPAFDRNLCVEATGGKALGCLPTGKRFLKPRCKSEKLGLQTIEGVQCQGMRATVSWPVGSQICNSHPVVKVTERWSSASLRLAVFEKQSEVGGWETVQRLMNISRTEPDPNLFKVPPDYKIVDSNGPVIINYTYADKLSNVAPPVMMTEPNSC